MSSLGFVVIGRNEGERLRRCLASLEKAQAVIVYVDSGSSDGSVQLAREMGAEAIELNMSIPFCAARARNEGFARLMQIAPSMRWVQFVDGDCEIVAGWIERATGELESNGELAAVCGQLRERFPEASIYNQFCDLEWDDAPAGITDACGGIAMYRVEYFQAVGGFDGSVAAGEEPELCKRLRGRGWKILRLGDEMGWHDAAMTRFNQWWRRQLRTGYNGLDVAQRFGVERSIRFSRSAQIWTLGPLGLVIMLWIVGTWRYGGLSAGWAVVIVGIILLVQALRIGRRKGGMMYGLMTLLSKWAQLFGQIEYYRDRRRGQVGRVIEYKQVRGSHSGPV